MKVQNIQMGQYKSGLAIWSASVEFRVGMSEFADPSPPSQLILLALMTIPKSISPKASRLGASLTVGSSGGFLSGWIQPVPR